MSVYVVLKLGAGHWQQGFPQVVLQLWGEQTAPVQMVGSLPPAPELADMYDRWRSLYQAMSQRLVRRAAIEIEDTGVTHVSRAEFDRLCQTLKTQFNTWLESPAFSRVERQLRTKLDPRQALRLMIETDEPLLRRFPWHLWHFFDDYPLAEVALSTPEYGYQAPARSPSQNLRLLAILGNSTGIDVQQDRVLLSQLPQVESTFLVEPDRPTLDRCLWDDRGWDILFFAGHTASQPDGFTGEIAINSTDCLTVAQLKNALKAAIARGLKLAIFNSCDGLGLAWEMADLQIPQLVVMREPVPDQVAQAFLTHLLAALTQSRPFYVAVREAREKLQGLESEFPCASWLPVICQNPAATTIDWTIWTTSSAPAPAPSPPQHPLSPSLLKRLSLPSFLITAAVMGIRFLGLLQSWELAAFDHLLRLRPPEGADPRILVVEVTQDDTEQYGYPLTDQTLANLVTAVAAHQPAAIGLDMHRSQPRGEGRSALLAQFQQHPNLLIACSFSPTDSNPPPPEFSPEQQLQQVGFSDLITEGLPIGVTIREDLVSQGQFRGSDTVRRQLLSYDPNLAVSPSPCATPYSFSLQLAFQFLSQAGVQPLTVNQQQNWQFGDVAFPKLSRRFGGYQQLDGQTSQVMINYRSAPPGARITLTQALQGQLNNALIQNRVVLVGTTAAIAKDSLDTPYGEMPGVWVHAHMVSQMLSAVLDQRPLIWSLPSWGDLQIGDWLWVWSWATLGGVLGWRLRSWLWLEVANGVSVAALHQLCLLLLVQGGWMPFIPSLIALLLTSHIVKVIGSENEDKMLNGADSGGK
ncbi:MAG: hypothetical protein Kow00121_62380 [Elainellaceae cyanobacterium]